MADSSRRIEFHYLFLRSARLLLLAALLGMLAGAAQAQPYGRGFVPPPDHERILAERLVVLDPDKQTLPSNFDWRTHDGLTPVKNQGSCGSCWAFAVIAEMESKIRIRYGKIVDLSEQQIISCNPHGAGCGGGWAGSAYYVLQQYGGVLEHCMPYEGSDFVSCTQDDYLKFADLDGWSSISNNVAQIKTAVYTNGPVSTAVDANQAWDEYTGGVITAPGYGTNHLVLIVGWDDRLGPSGAWIVKNSWGSSWGTGGYCFVAYGACNIGASTTQLAYTPPPAQVGVGGPATGAVLYTDEVVTLQWATQNQAVALVDLRLGTHGSCADEIIALGVPNTGSYEWLLPNVSTQRATVLVHPSEGTHIGFGFGPGEFTIIGKQTRYVSAAGGNVPPYDTPAKAAHSIAAAVLAGSGRDSVLVAGGNYLESGITVGTQCVIVGGWNADFTVCDPDLYPTRLRGPDGALRFQGGAADRCGVANIVFHDSQGRVGSVPVNGRHGAAIVSVNVSPVIEHCRFENNRADPGAGPGWGGAILAHGGSPVIRGSVFTGNVGSRGGAIALSQCAGALIEDCVFVANATSDSLAGNPGGAIYVDGGSATLRDSELRGGGAGVGGGLAIAGGAQVTVRDVTVTNNRAGTGGAGVHAAASTLDLARVQLVGNRNWSGGGAGLYADGVQLAMANVLIAANEAPSIGGGFYGASVTGGPLRNNVIHGNSGLSIGGALIGAAGPLAIHNNAVTANLGGGLLVSGAEAAADWNLAHGNTAGDFLHTLGAHDLVVAPRYVDADAGDFAPGLHSPLIDSGDPTAGPDWDQSPTDRGLHGGPTAVPAGPARVTDLAGERVGDAVHLAWTAIEGAASYVVYRDSSAVFSPAAHLARTTVEAPPCENQVVPAEGVWYFIVGTIDADGRAGGFSEPFLVTGGGATPVADPALPRALAIAGVVPNPFNPRAIVAFDLPRAGLATLQVFDLRGRLVATLHEGELPAGRHQAVWDGQDAAGRLAAAGVYLVRLHDGREAAAVKAILAK